MCPQVDKRLLIDSTRYRTQRRHEHLLPLSLLAEHGRQGPATRVALVSVPHLCEHGGRRSEQVHQQPSLRASCAVRLRPRPSQGL